MISSASTAGIQHNMQAMYQASEAIASSSPLSAEAVIQLKLAEHAVKANVAAANVVDKTTEYLLDILI